MTFRRLLTAIAASVVASIAAGSAASAATLDAAAPPTVPPGYQYVVDDTGSISIVIPEEWGDLDTEPAYEEDGTVVPYIEASSDRDAYRTTWTTSGVTFWLEAYEPDPQVLLGRYGISDSDCAFVLRQTYSDEVFDGAWVRGNNCGGSGASWTAIAASPADRSFSVVVQMQFASPADEVEARDMILASFDRTTAAAASGGPVVTAAPSGTPSDDFPAVEGITAGPASNPIGYPDEVMLLTSPADQLSVEVPRSWAALDYVVNSDTGLGLIEAVVDVDGFLTDGPGGFTSPGVRLVVSPPGPVTTEEAAQFLGAAFSIGCTESEPAPVTLTGGQPGHVVVITDCLSTTTMREVVVAEAASGNMLALIIQVTSGDDPALDLVLATADLA